jgi:hypothetical protein
VLELLQLQALQASGFCVFDGVEFRSCPLMFFGAGLDSIGPLRDTGQEATIPVELRPKVPRFSAVWRLAVRRCRLAR